MGEMIVFLLLQQIDSQEPTSFHRIVADPIRRLNRWRLVASSLTRAV